MRDYACMENSGELTSDKARFHAEAIDPEKGSATGYVAKYISKILPVTRWTAKLTTKAARPEGNRLGGFCLGSTLTHPAIPVCGRCAGHCLPRLRRMADSETAHGLSVEFAAAHDAADAGDWAGYVNAQGGPFVRRDELEAVCEKAIDQVRDLSGKTISRGLAVHLIDGTQTKIGGHFFRSLPDGELARPILEPKSSFVLERFAV